MGMRVGQHLRHEVKASRYVFIDRRKATSRKIARGGRKTLKSGMTTTLIKLRLRQSRRDHRQSCLLDTTKL